MDMYMLGANPMQLGWEFSITSELFPFTMFGPGEHAFSSRYATRFTTMIAETNVFLPALIEDFRSRGGAIEVRTFADPASLQVLDAPLIVNCTGLGAKALFGVLAPQTEVTYAYLDPVLDLYMFSRSDGIILGGSHGDGVWSTEIDGQRAAQILEGNSLIAAGMRI
jgi:hypothetical protein